MKKLIKSSLATVKANSTDDLRVISFGMDVVVPEGTDAYMLERRIQRALNEAMQGDANVVGVQFMEDQTDYYNKYFKDLISLD